MSINKFLPCGRANKLIFVGQKSECLSWSLLTKIAKFLNIEYILLPNQGPIRVVKNVHIYDLKKKSTHNQHIHGHKHIHAYKTTADQITQLFDRI